jgi:hypothetical protein
MKKKKEVPNVGGTEVTYNSTPEMLEMYCVGCIFSLVVASISGVLG